MKNIIPDTHAFDYQLCSWEQLSSSQQMLVARSRDACADAYAPYSEFRVGAAVELEDGKIITGANQENAAYPSGLCAERVALFHIGANYKETRIIRMAVAARDKKLNLPVTPCGSCRQVMLEYEMLQQKEIEVVLPFHDEKFLLIKKAGDLLPFHFNRFTLEGE